MSSFKVTVECNHSPQKSNRALCLLGFDDTHSSNEIQLKIMCSTEKEESRFSNSDNKWGKKN